MDWLTAIITVAVIDLPRHLMGCYQKQSCPTAAPSWAGPYNTLGSGLSPAGRFFFPVQPDGHQLTATIDTGSQLTVLATASARALGVTEAMLSRDVPRPCRALLATRYRRAFIGSRSWNSGALFFAIPRSS